VLASVWSWTGVRALGRHLRFDAALSEDHQLVRSGAYRWLRHPIYASMFCILLGTGFLFTPVPLLIAAVVVFAAGTEIRVRIEDSLLATRFGEQFRDYQRTVSSRSILSVSGDVLRNGGCGERRGWLTDATLDGTRLTKTPLRG